jgi:glyoxylase-like metal-dependent hydrolase (beta-lactamase superfamily II)
MPKRYAALVVLACVLFTSSASLILGQDAKSVLVNASKAMGMDALKTIQFSGAGSSAGIGQNRNPKTNWPLVRVKGYTRQMDFAAGGSHVQMVRVQNGADQTQDQYISSNSAWNTQFNYWLTPVGFIRGAMANNATVKSETIEGTKFDVVTFTVQDKYRVVGYINNQGLVEKVQTWIDNDVLGDMPVEAWHSGYKDFGGVKFPTMIVEKQAGFPVLILSVSDVKPNAAVDVQPAQTQPGAVAAVPSPSVQTEKVAEGVFYIRGGTHHSVAVEFADHAAVIEAPLNEQRSLAVIAEVKKLIPNKPIRYVVNTHHHFDHAGGLRAYVNEGATIITHETNREFFEKALSAPRTLNPDRLAQSPRKASIETSADKKVLTDGTRTLELHLIKGNPHNDGILMAFLPKEKLLIEVDVYTPAAAGAAANPTPNPNTVNTVDNVERLKLDFERILPLHGTGAVARADIYAAIGKPVPDLAAIVSAKPVVADAPNPGKQLLDNVCTSCHNLNRVTTKKLTQLDWQAVLDRMKGRGAIFSDDEGASLLEYLVKTYGPQ